MRDIALCHPRMQKIAAQWITACKAEGINVAISETLRTAAEQDALYAKGRTKPGNIVTNAKGSSYRSQHQWGIAFAEAIRTYHDSIGNGYHVRGRKPDSGMLPDHAGDRLAA